MGKGEKILQILEESSCLTEGQLKGYLQNQLSDEELRVVELHLASCSFCREALVGLEKMKDLAFTLDALMPPILPKLKQEEVKLNSKTEAVKGNSATKYSPIIPKSTFGKSTAPLSHRRNMSWLGVIGIAAFLILGGFLFWQFSHNNIHLPDFGLVKNENNTTVSVMTDSSLPRDKVKTDSEQENELLVDEDSPRLNSTNSHLLAATEPDKNNTPFTNQKPLKIIAHKEKDKEQNFPTLPSASPVGASNKGERKSTPLAKKELLKKDRSPRPQKIRLHNQSSENSKKESAAKKVKTASMDTSSKNTTAKPPKNINAKPKAEESHFKKGVQLYRQNQYAKALEYLHPIAKDKKNPHQWDATYFAALCYMHGGKKGRARRYLRRVIKNNGRYTQSAKDYLKQL